MLTDRTNCMLCGNTIDHLTDGNNTGHEIYDQLTDEEKAQVKTYNPKRDFEVPSVSYNGRRRYFNCNHDQYCEQCILEWI